MKYDCMKYTIKAIDKTIQQNFEIAVLWRSAFKSSEVP